MLTYYKDKYRYPPFFYKDVSIRKEVTEVLVFDLNRLVWSKKIHLNLNKLFKILRKPINFLTTSNLKTEILFRAGKPGGEINAIKNLLRNAIYNAILENLQIYCLSFFNMIINLQRQ